MKRYEKEEVLNNKYLKKLYLKSQELVKIHQETIKSISDTDIKLPTFIYPYNDEHNNITLYINGDYITITAKDVYSSILNKKSNVELYRCYRTLNDEYEFELIETYTEEDIKNFLEILDEFAITIGAYYQESQHFKQKAKHIKIIIGDVKTNI